MFEPMEEYQDEALPQHQLTLDEIMAERDRLLAEARTALQAEREMFEQENICTFKRLNI